MRSGATPVATCISACASTRWARSPTAWPRTVPNLDVTCPGDANETAVAWKVAIETRDRPTALILSRQNVSTLDRTKFASAEGVRKGAYVLLDAPGGSPDLIVIGTGAETDLVAKAVEKLQAEGTKARAVSMPSWEWFAAQDQAYRDSVDRKSVV